ncbi:hypothetical protein [Pseudomonas protegens]|uniref:hypothetical protein n=1 Tax=Pseudomonas protegens TaxID=380021 RepID=UPI001F2C4A67|nr:hypothetical protein [Pseudomonas protegens]
MEINNRPLPPLTSGGTHGPITLPVSDTPPPPMTAEQKEALERLRDQPKQPATPAPSLTPAKTSLIDEVV